MVRPVRVRIHVLLEVHSLDQLVHFHRERLRIIHVLQEAPCQDQHVPFPPQELHNMVVRWEEV